jgi:hypothetical protein
MIRLGECGDKISWQCGSPQITEVLEGGSRLRCDYTPGVLQCYISRSHLHQVCWLCAWLHRWWVGRWQSDDIPIDKYFIHCWPKYAALEHGSSLLIWRRRPVSQYSHTVLLQEGVGRISVVYTTPGSRVHKVTLPMNTLKLGLRSIDLTDDELTYSRAAKLVICQGVGRRNRLPPTDARGSQQLGSLQ